MKRQSLHIGLNRVDPDCWNGWDGALGGCVSDAESMRDVAEQKGFTAKLLLNDDATVEALHQQLKAAATALREGDFFFLTYAGHGGQVPDTDGDEPDGYDETWCLYDGQFVDDTLYGAFCTFAPGVRIFVMSDSCHSGSVTRDPTVVAREAARTDKERTPGANARQAPREKTVAEFKRHSDAYAAQQGWWPSKSNPAEAAAMVVLLSGCKDDQTSSDGPAHGAFTQGFLDVWGDGDYRHNYSQLRDEVNQAIGLATQTPQLFTYGTGVADMIAQIPLGDEEA